MTGAFFVGRVLAWAAVHPERPWPHVCPGCAVPLLRSDTPEPLSEDSAQENFLSLQSFVAPPFRDEEEGLPNVWACQLSRPS